MIQMLINSLILLGGIGLPIAALFWKHFAKTPGESTRAVLATMAGIVGLVIFFFQVAIMTAKCDNIITIIHTWLF